MSTTTTKARAPRRAAAARGNPGEWSMGYDARQRFEFVIGHPTRGKRVILSTQEALAIASICLDFVIEGTGGAGPAKLAGSGRTRKR
jgi:hypothetical protein